MHIHPTFKDMKKIGDLTNSRYVFEHCLTLPLYDGMTEEEQDMVVEELKSFIKNKSFKNQEVITSKNENQ